MVADALIFLIQTVAWLFTLALMLRFLLQWARAAPRNPISEFVNALTDFAVRPLRRFIPGLWGLDLATLLLAWLVQFVELILVLQLAGGDLGASSAPQIAAIAGLAAVKLMRLILYIIIGVLIIQAVLSWVNPYSPVALVLNAITRPLLRPFQRRIPAVANVDLSPLFVIVLCQLLLIVLSHAG